MIILNKIGEYLRNNYSNIGNTFIAILVVYFGAYLALKNSNETNKDISIRNYKSMLISSEQLERQYLDYVKKIIDSLNSNSKNLSAMNRLIKNMDKPFILEELLRRSV